MPGKQSNVFREESLCIVLKTWANYLKVDFMTS